MKSSSPRNSRRAFALLATVVAITAVCWLGSSWFGTVEAKLTQATETLVKEPMAFDSHHPKVQAALAAQQRHTPNLLSHPEVVGTATSIDNVDEPTVVVYTKRAVTSGDIPAIVDGIPVTMKVSGEIFPMAATGVYPRPVPIGVSVGNAGECSAGTIGARVRDSSNRIYALSNNHVFALENIAPQGSKVLQPGLFDSRPQCSNVVAHVIGSLYDFEPISFTSNNIMDAAIARCNGTTLGRATPAGGYGVPRAAKMAAAVNLKVQKYGRTTSLTRGKISAINGTFRVTYDAGTARFINQIVVTSTTAFILPGDSGSLLVTDPGRYPVGLLFAGDASGTMAIANPIGPVLQRFRVGIDGN